MVIFCNIVRMAHPSDTLFQLFAEFRNGIPVFHYPPETILSEVNALQFQNYIFGRTPVEAIQTVTSMMRQLGGDPTDIDFRTQAHHENPDQIVVYVELAYSWVFIHATICFQEILDQYDEFPIGPLNIQLNAQRCAQHASEIGRQLITNDCAIFTPHNRPEDGVIDLFPLSSEDAVFMQDFNFAGTPEGAILFARALLNQLGYNATEIELHAELLDADRHENDDMRYGVWIRSINDARVLRKVVLIRSSLVALARQLEPAE